MKPEDPTPSVLCVGAVVQDTLAISERALKRGDDLPGRASVRPGGVATNIAVALARRGVRAALVGAVGEDAIGRNLQTALQAAGIDCRDLIRRPGDSDQVITLENPDGERFAAVADCRQLDAAAAEQPDAFLDAVRRFEGTVVLDGNLPTALLDRVLAATASAAYLVPASADKAAHLAPTLSRHRPALIVNRREAERVLGAPQQDSRTAALALKQHGAGDVAVTDGADSATLVTDSDVVSAEPPRVTTASSTGAGDAFVAGLVAAEGRSAQQRLASAMDAAAVHLGQGVHRQ